MINSEFEMFSLLCNLSVLERDICQKEIDEIQLIRDKLGINRIHELAIQHKMLPFIANLMNKVTIDTSFWLPIFKVFRSRNQHILKELEKIYKALCVHGVNKIFVSENFGALLSAKTEIALFASGDIDNYADISEYEKICNVFLTMGYSKHDRYTGRLLISTNFTNKEIFPDDFEIGIEWYPLSRLKLPCFVDAKKFVQWEKAICYKDTHIKLAPLDVLMYICLLHISLHSFCRAPSVRLYRDIVNISKNIGNNDWDEIAHWTVRDKVCRRISTSSYIANSIFKVGIPDRIVKCSNEKNMKVVKMAFIESKKMLKSEPSRFKVLLIEILCNDGGFTRGLLEMISPDREWIRKVYGRLDVIAYINHIIALL